MSGAVLLEQDVLVNLDGRVVATHTHPHGQEIAF